MIIAIKELLNNFVQSHADSATALNRWVKEVQQAQWKSHRELKLTFPSADYVKNGRYVFNIKGNVYRLVVLILFTPHTVYIRFVGTHADYDKIDDIKSI